jgi:hypothetical protein
MDEALAGRAHAIATAPGMDAYLADSPAVLADLFGSYLSMYESAGIQLRLLDCDVPTHTM